MPQIMIFTGSPGAGVAIAACAAALGMAGHGQKTLLLTLGSAVGLGALLGVELGPRPVEVVAGLDVFAPDPNAELATAWEQGRRQMPEAVARLAADELPLPAGAGALAGLLKLSVLRTTYQRVVVDAGPHDALLLALGLPDTARWFVRLLLGLDRGPGQSRSSVLSSILPAGFLPSGFVDGAQDVRIQLEQARAELTAPSVTSVCYVLRPDLAALAEARLAIPAIQLHGLAVSALAIGPLASIAALHEADAVSATQAVFTARALTQLPTPIGAGLGSLAALAPAVQGCDPTADPAAPLGERYADMPAMVIDLPGLPKGALGLTISGDELIVRIGPYRRHMLLPEGLRGMKGVRATREGDLLIVRRRA